MKYRELFLAAVDVNFLQILIIDATLQLQQISLGILWNVFWDRMTEGLVNVVYNHKLSVLGC